MSVDLESRTRNALRQFDSNMSGIFDRASFYDQDLYSQAAYPQLTKAQLWFKYGLLAMNVLFMIFGCVLIAVGSYAVNNQVGSLVGTTLPTGITVLGVFILLLSLLGGISAWREIRALLLIYFLILLLLTIILFAIGIAVLAERSSLSNWIADGFLQASDDLKANLQNFFSCCGLYTYRDDNAFLPCPTDSTVGCLDQFTSYLESYYQQAGGCAIAFAIIMLLGMVVVCHLMNGIKQKRAEQDLAKLRAQTNTADDSIEVSHLQPQGKKLQVDDDDDDIDEDLDDEDEGDVR